MTNEEKARICATEVHGWHVGYDDGSHRLWLNGLGARRGKVSEYTPATNVAQAIKAVIAWRKKGKRSWSLEDVGGKFIVVLLDEEEPVGGACAKWPAKAITDALVKAVSDD